MKTITGIISDKLSAAFSDCGYDGKYGVAGISNRPDLCQFQCNGCMAAAKEYKKAPLAIAQEIVQKLSGDTFFSKAEACPPGFINISLSDAVLAGYAADMARSERLGFEPGHTGRTAVVDYGGANVAKPLHVGHLRPAIIGESVKRIEKYDGYETIGDAHLGDWGLPIGLIITEMAARNPELPYFDPEYTGEYPDKCPVSISDLEEIYPTASARSKEDEEYRSRARTAVVDLQKGRRGYIALWKQIMDISKADLRKNYDNLNVHFELWNGESDADALIMPMIEEMKKKGITRISEGALVVDVKEDTDKKEMPPCILLKSDGAAIYASTDLATLVDRENRFHPDKVIYVVDKRQGLHFEQVFRTSRKAGIVRDETELIFLGNGTINDKNGSPFKTRDGGVMRLEALIGDVVDKVLEKMSDRDMTGEEKNRIARIVGLAALKYGDLSNQATKDYNFDIDRFTSFEGNTGPYILYTMVRIRSILEKCGMSEFEKLTGCDCDFKNVTPFEEGWLEGLCKDREISESERKLLLSLTSFSSALRYAADELAPHRLCSFIYELSDCFNGFYHDNRIVTEEKDSLKKAWIALILLVYEALGIVLYLLGIVVPERM
ncbi:MAG: arginine--tRNA ligase [Lachnospiraceae bacterium]|nr:arginine--tRNA ligase [Lachnospiraceae bacterium]